MDKNNSHLQNRDGLLLRSAQNQSETRSAATTSSDFVLQWGNRKKQTANRATVRIDWRVVRSDHHNKEPSTSAKQNFVSNSNGYLNNLRQRPASPAHRILRNPETIGMRGQSNGGVRRVCSPDRGVSGAQDKKLTPAAHNSTNTNSHVNNCIINNGAAAGGSGSTETETAHDSKKGGSSSGSEAIPVVWPPKFMIGLTNKEKEEDFLALKGSKLPQRPKKRAKFIQRTLNLVSPGAWLCDLTLERYQVREKKISKKRPRGLKAMGNIMDSDSE